jgi:hypothetical protein
VGDVQGLAWSPDGTRLMTDNTAIAIAIVTIWHIT